MGHLLNNYWQKNDPRTYQIIVLSILVLLGLFQIGFLENKKTVLLFLFSCQLTQIFFCKVFLRREKIKYSFLSPLITSLSLILILRLPEEWMAVLVSFVAISSKFLIRVTSRKLKGHFFNPAMLGIVFAVLFLNGWTSAGQWGQAIFYLFLALLIGGLVSLRSSRVVTALCFLTLYSLLLFLRVIWLGDPFAILWHQLSSGSFLLFTFFMITDPMTTPQGIKARLLFIVLVALLAFTFRFYFYMNNTLFLSLFIISFLTPVFNKIDVEKRFEWKVVN